MRRMVDAAAVELVARGGGIEMGAVARRAGVSVGLPYHYFGSKDGLIAAVVDAFYDRYDAAVMAPNPLPRADWPTRERARLEALVRFMSDEPLAPILLGRLYREPAVAGVEAVRIARHVELSAVNIARGQSRGEIPPAIDPALAGAMILGGLRQAMGEALARRPRPPTAQMVRQLWNFVMGIVGLAEGRRTHS